MRDQTNLSAHKVTIFVSILRKCAGVLIALLLSIPAQAKAEDVALLVWIQDYRGTFMREKYDKEVEFLQKKLSVPLRSVFLSPEHSQETWMRQLRESLRNEDRISSLILATHGATNRIFNQTWLMNLGSFGWLGTSGFLPKMISGLSGNWGASLSVFLNACSTFCGAEVQVASRARSLFKEFQMVGVRQMLIWGATQTMDIREPGKFESTGVGEDYPGDALADSRLWGVLAGVAAGIAVHYIDVGTWPQWAALFSSYYFVSRFYRQTLKIGSHGRLIHINSTDVKILDVDANDERLRDMSKCEIDLNPRLSE